MITSKCVHLVIKQTLVDQFISDWRSKLQSSNKGKTYNLFKTEIKLEPYLLTLPRYLYLPILKYRTANHKLPIEKGRWSGVPYNDRKCESCPLQLADEFHYLLTCQRFRLNVKSYCLGTTTVMLTYLNLVRF